MYTSYFGFNEKPFTLTPNPRFIFLSNSHGEALAHLLYGIENHHGFIKLTGEVGTGKTTLLRTLLTQLDEKKYRTALIFNPCVSGTELLRNINLEYNISTESKDEGDLLHSLNQFLLEENSSGHTVVLVIDEAQNLKPEVLEYIRLLSNLETENEKLIQIILAGQPELKNLLKKKELRQLNQRIAIRYTLKAMSRGETARYIRHRTDTACDYGGEIFTSSSILPIHLFTRGNPRLINILCDRALLIAFSNDQRVITAATIVKAIWELKGLPVSQPESSSTDCGSTISPIALPETKEVLPDHQTEENVAEEQEDDEIIELTEQLEKQASSVPEQDQFFDLGAELRQEIDFDQSRYASGELARELKRFDQMIEELNNPALPGGVLLVLRFASEFMKRAVFFTVNGQTISGTGQSGINGGDDGVKAINCNLDPESMFYPCYATGQPKTFTPEYTPANLLIFEQLGGEIPAQIFLAPIVCDSMVIGFLYGDNLPGNKQIKSTEALETFLTKAAPSVKKQLLEQQSRGQSEQRQLGSGRFNS